MLPKVGDPAGVGVGVAVGVGLGVGLGVGVGVGVGAVTVTVPTMPQHAPCGVQKYEKSPALVNVNENVSPKLRTPESHIPSGNPGVPDVVL